MRNALNKLLFVLDSQERKKSFILTFLVLIGAILEMIGISIPISLPYLKSFLCVRENIILFLPLSFPSVINEYLKAKIEATYSKFLFYKAVDKLE